MPTKSGLQSRQQRDVLFAQGGQIAPNTAKSLSAKDGAKTARNLLLELDHAHIPLRLIVVKIHPKIFQEAEEGLLVFAQPIEQVAGRALLGSSPCSWGSGRPGMGQIPFVKDVEKLAFPIGNLQWVKPMFSLFASLLGGLFHIQEQAFQVCGPLAFLLFRQKEQFSQHMHVTTGMHTRVQEVGSPSIMDRDPRERRQDPDSIQGGLTSVGMHLIMGQGRRASHMHPVSLPRHTQSRLILMDDLRLDQGVFDLLLHLHQPCCAFLGQLTQGAFAHLDAYQITQALTSSCQRQQLLLGQIYRCRGKGRSVLDGSGSLMRKRSSGDVLTHRRLFVFRAIFSHNQTRSWDINDLSALDVTGCNRVQIVLARFTLLNVVLHHFIWAARPAQARSWMAWLPSRFLLALCAQAFRLASKTIRGRWQVTIVAIFGEPILQGFHLLGQTTVLLTQLLNQDVLLPEQRL